MSRCLYNSFLKQLSAREYTQADIVKVISTRCQSICEAIDVGAILNQSRDNISKKSLRNSPIYVKER